MRKKLRSIYYFLPVQLFLLHFRKYQLLLIFWIIVVLTITDNFASHFGASSLFLSPEYLGNINFLSMLLLGSAFAVFIMGWHITTFIIHSKRMPFLGAARQSFLLYCLNNAIIPLAVLIFYSIVSIRFQWRNEHASFSQIIFLQLGFYLGILVVVLISFAYFFRVSRDLLKVVLSKITNPSVIREIIPYDTLDDEIDLIRAETFISENLKIQGIALAGSYDRRVAATVLRRHHRNAVFATIVAYIILLLLGIFMDTPALRIPAGAGFLMLFSIILGMVGAIKYFLKSWETIGWVLFALLLSLMVKYSVFDLRSIAYGLDYHKTGSGSKPVYEYDNLRNIFTPQRYEADKKTEEERLTKWKHNAMPDTGKPALIVITVSGGGSRSAYWTFRSLQYMDSMTHGKLFKNTVLITGASGGMIGAAYWRSIHEAYEQDLIKDPYAQKYQDNVGKDLLNAVVFSLASVDLISPFNKISFGGYSYTRDRGYALEEELVKNTDSMLNKRIGDFKQSEANGQIPEMIINGTIINDGRKLMMCAQPISFLTRPEYSMNDTVTPTIDAVDFAEFFADQNPYDLRITSALRMNATFPYVLPVVRLPSQPAMNIMDAGLRDNFGTEVTSRYLYVMRDWLKENTGNVIFLQIRDTREYDVLPASEQNTLGEMIADPLFVIQDKWEAFQSYYNSYLKDYAPYFLDNKLQFVTLQYVPKEAKKMAALNFHLTQTEKEDLYNSIYSPENIKSVNKLLDLLH